MKATVTNSDDTTDIKSAQITISINIVPEPDEDPVFFLNDSTDIDMNQKTHQFHSVGTELYVISAKDRDKLTSSIEYFASSSSDYFEVAGAASIDDFYGTISDKIVVKTKKPLINAMGQIHTIRIKGVTVDERDDVTSDPGPSGKSEITIKIEVYNYELY